MAFRNYTYEAATSFNGQKLTFGGRFSVRPIQVELFETTASHSVLQQLSGKIGGETLPAANMAAVADKIKANQGVKPAIYQTVKTCPLINLKWIFGLLVLLLGAE